MPYDPFVTLGIRKGATQSEILDAYKAKRAEYSSHVFDEGEAGAEAARMLEQVDEAYQLAMEYAHENADVSDAESFSADQYSAVKDAIKSKDFEGAQTLLDNMSSRGGEWHYYQAIIYYEKSWLNESKKQLELALNLDPNNEKYRRALDNMIKKIDGTNAFSSNKETSSNYAHSGRTYQQNTMEDGCCAACQALWCMDCCCECMGGDLIRCC